MSNPLVDMKNMFSTGTKSALIGEVTERVGGKVTVRLRAGNSIVVWGNEEIGAEVLIRDKQVIAVVNKENLTTVYIP